MSIDVYDNFFTEEEHLFIIDYCIKASYFYGEGGGSDSNSPTNFKYCTGLVHEVYHHTEDNPLSDESHLIGGDPSKIVNQKKLFNLFSCTREDTAWSELCNSRIRNTPLSKCCRAKRLTQTIVAKVHYGEMIPSGMHACARVSSYMGWSVGMLPPKRHLRSLYSSYHSPFRYPSLTMH